MKLCLLYSNSSHRGPGMVVQNLVAGLVNQTDSSVEIIKSVNEADYVGCLQYPGIDLIRSLSASKTLMGPNIFVLPGEEKELCEKYKNFIVPSKWIKEKYLREVPDKNIFIWPVGIDTVKWNKKIKGKTGSYDCLVYYKNRSKQDLEWVKKLLKITKQTYKIIEYGKYLEKELFEKTMSCKYAILLTGTESQGIAYMNILSTNTPCYVFNKNQWVYEKDSSFIAQATSVPCFDEKRCGEIITNNINTEHFKKFLNNVEEGLYSPRDYILENHTLVKSAQNYLSILEQMKNEF